MSDGLSQSHTTQERFCPIPQTRTVCTGVPPLLIAFYTGSVSVTAGSDGDDIVVSVEGDSDGVVVSIGDHDCELDRADAATLRAAIGDAMADRRTFVRTACEYRPDGRYAVERRAGDDSAAKVFEDIAAVEELYESLPDEFDAADIGRSGITGSRRQLLVRHFAEQPSFDCRLVCRNPLTARKTAEE